MQSFKQYLLEAKDNGFAPWHIRDPEKVREYIDHFCYAQPNDFAYLKDGSVRCKKALFSLGFSSYKGEVKTTNGEIGLPFKINSFSDRLTIRHPKITNIQGIPTKGEYLKLIFDSVISFEGLTASYKHFNIDCENLTSFKCNVTCQSVFIGKVKSLDIKDLTNSFEGDANGITVSFEADMIDLFYRKPLLSLLKMKPFLRNIVLPSDLYKESHTEKSDELKQVFDIINKHSQSKDIISCQEELMDKGLGQYAKF